ncbi:MAG: hypothetical protein JNL93_04490 [Pelomonas sp.]|nr:hypothetical protein [Roseateles sp.]
MHIPASPPSCCAGLRQTLLQGWQQDFPLHTSPFRLMAARSGAKPRELLDLCRQLSRSGALLPIRVRWGAALRRERWRLAFNAQPGFRLALASLPGCFRIESVDTSANLPTIWAEVEALNETALHRQLARLALRPVARIRLPSSANTVCCDDPLLAARVEQGLQICSRPFAECAKQLGCSEHHVISSLSSWRRGGQVEGLMLKPPPTSTPQYGVLALWRRTAPTADLLARLRELPGVDNVLEGPGSPEWPWQLSVVVRTACQPGAEQWRKRLATAGLAAAPDVSLPLRIEQPRDQALLFNT